MPTKAQAHARRVIRSLGGTFEVARLCGGIRPQSVSQWKRNGIPPARAQFLALLRPDLFQTGKKPAAPVRKKAA